MIQFPNKNKEISTEIVVKTIWISTFLAMILSLPPLGLFIGIYFVTGNLIIGAFVGFGVHFTTLIFSSKISKFLTNIIS
jgi:putative methionine-R-sulfoxide reductase with GAF domain